MINDSNIGGMSGAPVHGPDDRKIGTVGQVFVDPDTGMPNWITVHTGLFGRRESFVPLDGATWDNEVIRVAIDKEIIRDAPRIDAGEPLTPENEAALYRYYAAQTADAASGDGETTSVPGASDDSAAGNAGREEASAPGRSRLRQYQRPVPDAATTEPGPAAGRDEPVDADNGPGVADDPHAYTIEDAGTDPGAETGAAAGTAADAGTGAVPGTTETTQPRGRHARHD